MGALAGTVTDRGLSFLRSVSRLMSRLGIAKKSCMVIYNDRHALPWEAVADLLVIRGYVLRIAVFGVFLGEIIPFRPFRFIMRGKYFQTLRPSISRRKSHFVHSDRLENLDFDI